MTAAHPWTVHNATMGTDHDPKATVIAWCVTFAEAVQHAAKQPQATRIEGPWMDLLGVRPEVMPERIPPAPRPAAPPKHIDR